MGAHVGLEGDHLACWDKPEVWLRRVEFLCHDINVHVPHHVSSKIPWYNLRAATDSLRSNWGQVQALLLA